jgi:hypothetical protein
MKTRVVNIKRGEPYDQYIGRVGHGQDGYFGNPITNEDRRLSKAEVIEAFRVYFYRRLETDSEFKQRVLELKGKTLGCFCSNKRECHGTVIVEYLEQRSSYARMG